MKLNDLDLAVRRHAGEFLCRQINHEATTKRVRFEHVATLPDGEHAHVPEAGKLRDFHETFGSLLLYHDPKSGDAARYIAPVGEWPQLHDDFSGWIENLDEDELEEIVPLWVHSCLVIGETPRSGNYILMPMEGDEAGHVFEFDHDGFEFIEMAEDIQQYVERFLKPDGQLLVQIASNMRFRDEGSDAQWWIHELRDDMGQVVANTV